MKEKWRKLWRNMKQTVSVRYKKLIDINQCLITFNRQTYIKKWKKSQHLAFNERLICLKNCHFANNYARI